MRTPACLRAIFLLFFLYGSVSPTLSAPLLAIYPEAPPPYREAFAQMLEGLTHTAGMPVLKKMMTATMTQEAFDRWLVEGRNQILVLLGQQALHFYAQSGHSRSDVFVTGVNALPGQVPFPGISLTVDPALYFRTLHELLPQIRRVVVYYNHQEEPWLLLVKNAAKEARIEVESIGVTDAFDLARRLGTTFATLDPHTTALWFGNNTIQLNDALIYAYVLEQTWDRGIAVFSETLAHVKRGFLFALYPDYTQIGAALGALIRQKTPSAGLQFSRAGPLALNLRTARHLGLTVRDDLIQRAYPLYSAP